MPNDLNAIDYNDDDIDRLPRERVGPLNARIYVGGDGSVNIELEGGGFIIIHETDDAPDWF